ncbi:MAG: translation initiation factor IF-2 [Flavobacteriaceae bacterium]|nr:MAG: translation initiation factor IF-2 [Flavobacteriaceae bacterium]
MSGSIRLNKVLKELNISMERAVEFLHEKSIEIEARPTSKIDQEVYDILKGQFQSDKKQKEASEEVVLPKLPVKKEEPLAKEEVVKATAKGLSGPKTVGKIDLESLSPSKEKKVEAPLEKEDTTKQTATKISAETIKETQKENAKDSSEQDQLIKAVAPVSKLKVQGSIDLSKTEISKRPSKAKKQEEKQVEIQPQKPVDKKEEKQNPEPIVEIEPVEIPAEAKTEETLAPTEDIHKTNYTKLDGPKLTGQTLDLSKFERKPSIDKKKRKRIQKDVKPTTAGTQNQAGNRPTGNKQNPRPARVAAVEPTEEDVQKQIKETLERLTNKGAKSKGSKYRRDKRKERAEEQELEMMAQSEDKTLRVTEFVTINELASLMNVGVTEVISTCMSLGIMVTMNQRLDAETLTIVVDEFGFDIEFAKIEQDLEEEIPDSEEDLLTRAPIITVMGHVDHGKTSLLDYIRKENVIAGESGGITQHIGAYSVVLKNGQKIAFLDTPGHEAFTAMRARGAQVTDLVIIVVAADDDVMPQTKEAISHAQAAEVPMIFAINKMDKPTANPDNIKTQLSTMNILVEDWGGKYQSQEISAKTGMGVEELLEKVLLEAEMLDLKANPNREASGAVIEAALDKGRGYVSTLMVQNGTLKIGDYVVAGSNHGKVKAMLDERGHPLKNVGPSTPVTILGLDGAPTAGDKFRVYLDEKEAKQIASKRDQLQREQTIRTQKHLTLDEIGRRIALGEFQQLNIILKGDVDGSVEALTDSLQKLSTEEIMVKILHRGVGQITESDVLLAAASDAIIIGFNVRPASGARDIADKEEVEIRTYSIIYDAISDVKEAMEGMLSPDLKEEITGNVEIRETFKISKIGVIAGCMVQSGKIFRNSNIRIIRDGVVIHQGLLDSLRRFKDDVKEVSKGYECGLNIKGFNDILEGDIIEAYQEVEVKKTLK